MNPRVLRWYRRSTWSAAVALIIFSMAATAFFLTGELIGSGVDDAVMLASAQYPGDRVQALMAYVASDRNPLPLRNRAVWALGQLGDGRALPVLERHYTGGPCDHSRLICQHELEKAIRLCRGAHNVTAVVWR